MRRGIQKAQMIIDLKQCLESFATDFQEYLSTAIMYIIFSIYIAKKYVCSFFK